MKRFWRWLTGRAETEPKPDPSIILAIGDTYRLRRLIDGRYVGEMLRRRMHGMEWEGVDVQQIGYTWPVGDRCYPECVGSIEQVVTALGAMGAGATHPDEAYRRVLEQTVEAQQ